MKKRQFYIYEREYVAMNGKIDYKKINLWQNMIGKRLVDELYYNRGEVKGYLENQEWNSLNKNIKYFEFFEELSGEIREFLLKNSHEYNTLTSNFLLTYYMGYTKKTRLGKKLIFIFVCTVLCLFMHL